MLFRKLFNRTPLAVRLAFGLVALFAVGTQLADDGIRPEQFYNSETDADWGPAILKATFAASKQGGNVVKFTCGKTYKVDQKLIGDLNRFEDKFVGSVEWIGCATDYEYGGSKPSIEVTGAGDAGISLRSSYGFRLTRMKIQYTNPAFRGRLFDFSHSEIAKGGNGGDTAYLTISDSTLTGTNEATDADALVYLGGSIISSIEKSHFFYAKQGIRGMEAAGGNHYAYVYTIAKNSFNMVDRAIVNPSSNWVITNNTFEPNRFGQLIAVENDCGDHCTQASGITFSNNYLGDGGAQQHPIVRFKKADGLTIQGNWWYSDDQVSQAAITLDTCEGVVVSGNSARPFKTFIELTGGTTFGLTTISNKINANAIVTENGAQCAGCNIMEPSRAGTAPRMTRFSSMMATDYAAEAPSVFDIGFGWKANEQHFINGGVYSIMDNAYGLVNGAIVVSAGKNGDAPVCFKTDNKIRGCINGSGLKLNAPFRVPRAPYGDNWAGSDEAPTKGDVRAEIEQVRKEVESLRQQLQMLKKAFINRCPQCLPPAGPAAEAKTEEK